MNEPLFSHRLNGIGEYYFSQKLSYVEELKKQGHNVLNLGIGSPDLKPPREVEEALIEGIKETGYNQYQSYKGIPDLRIAFSKWYQRYFRSTLDPNTEVLPLIGSKEGIMHTSMALLNQGDEVLVPNPGYPSYASASKLAGGELVYYELKEINQYLPDFNILEQRDLSKVKLMWVNYPHMPTGTDGSEALFKKLLSFSRKHKIVVINDNPYGFILTQKKNSLLEHRQPNDLLLELNSLSKSHNLAGWRVGMIGGNKVLIQAILTFKSNMDSGQFKPVMRAAIKALEMGEEWYISINEAYKQRRLEVFRIARLLGCSYEANQVGMFVWASIPSNFEDGKEFADHLLEKYHIFIPPGVVFGIAGRGYIRFSLCSNMETWKEVITRIKNNK